MYPAMSRAAAPAGETLAIEFAQVSESGRARNHNEDYLGHARPETAARARSHGWMFALADGVGGHDLGEVASRAAVEHLLEGFRAAPAGEPLRALLPRLVQNANLHVYETGKQAGPGGLAMATTIVACALRHDRAVVAHVGDSRCYLVRQGKARILTRDHTVAGEHVRMGILTAGEAEGASTANLLSRSLGSDLFVNVDIDEHALLPGDVLALCCDGVHHSVQPADIAAAAASQDLHAAAREIAALANQRDGSDNISVQLIRIRSIERVGMYRGRPYTLR
jgi:protein phosphatase